MGQRLGQHFLSDYSVLEWIRDQIFLLRDEQKKTKTVEIWPGQWALTKEILGWFSEILALEADTDLELYINRLSKQAKTLGTKFDVVWWDVLQQDPLDLLKNRGWVSDWLVVWNLPYYITSPIFRRFFVDHKFSWWVFLIQKEVGQKMSTDSSKKSYLWRLMRYSCFVEYNFTVAPDAFTPPPKVDSAVVTVRRHNEKYPFTFERMTNFLDAISGLSRKTLWKIQKMRSEQLNELGISINEKIASKRLEAISWEEFTQILTE